MFFGLAFERTGDGFEDKPILQVEHVLKRALTLSVAVLHELHARDAGNKRHRRERPEGRRFHGDILDVEVTVRMSGSMTRRRRWAA
ncbi:MAG: hypothetical protein OXL68_02270 [Paracoccaceae bacterium]|nr:hypothetical protein [Paracoccaceae bacterium]